MSIINFKFRKYNNIILYYNMGRFGKYKTMRRFRGGSKRNRSTDSIPSDPDIELMKTQQREKAAKHIQAIAKARIEVDKRRKFTKRRFGTHQNPTSRIESKRRFMEHQRHLNRSNLQDDLPEYLQHYYFPKEPTYEYMGKNPYDLLQKGDPLDPSLIELINQLDGVGHLKEFYNLRKETRDLMRNSRHLPDERAVSALLFEEARFLLNKQSEAQSEAQSYSRLISLLNQQSSDSDSSDGLIWE